MTKRPHGDDLSSAFAFAVDNVEHNCWPEFMRRLGCKYYDPRRPSYEEKRKMLDRWSINIGNRADKISAVQNARMEIFEEDLLVDTRCWAHDMRNNRGIAVLFYGVIREYCDNDVWRRMVREDLQLRSSDIVEIESDYSHNSNEEKFMILDRWTKLKRLDNESEIKDELRKIGIACIVSTPNDGDTVERFRPVLQARAKLITAKMDLPISLERAIKAVTLQILKGPKTVPEHLDTVGHYSRRQDMSHVYENPRGDIQIEQLFDFAEQNAIKASKSMTHTAKDDYILRHSNNILVTGQAGIGKTTLSRMVTDLILNDEILSETKFLIYVKVRSIDFKQRYNIVEFLSTFCGFSTSDSSAEFHKLTLSEFDQLQQSAQAVMIFDGLDEANTSDFKDDVGLWDITKDTDASVILRKIMNGEVLSKAKKLWTSRQRQAYDIHENVRPHTIVQVLGLDEYAQAELGKQICTEERWLQVRKYLDNHPDIEVICYVPVMCIIAVSSIYTSMVNKDEDVEMKTMTDVLAYALDLYTRSPHLRDKQDEISKIPNLAWDGFCNGKIIFDEEDFRKAEIYQEAFEAFLVTGVYEGTNFRLKLVVGDKRSSFSHLIWQEMFTAIRAIMFTKHVDLQTYLSKLTDARWEVVAKLMYGLCHAATIRRLQKIFPGHLRDQLQENRNVLKGFVTRLTEKYRRLNDRESDEKMQMLIQICTWARETSSDDFVSSVRTYLPDVIDIVGEVTPSDVRCITHVIPSGQSIRVGAHKPVQFIGKSLLLLSSEIMQKRLLVLELNLEGNNLNKYDPAAYFACLTQVKELKLLKCRISDTALKEIAKNINDRQTLMENLDLSHNPVSITGAKYLASCIHNVNNLNIDSCDFNDTKFALVFDKIKDMNHSIGLHVGYTNIDNRAARAFCSGLHNIRSMAFARCGILDEGFLKFTSTIQNLDKPVNEVILSTNISAKNDLSKMSDDAKSTEVAKCLRNIKRLKLNCWIRASGAKILSASLQQLNLPMEMLDISGNKFGDEGVSVLAPCLANVKKIVLENCAITKTGFLLVKAAFCELSQNSKPEIIFGTIDGVNNTTLV